MLKVNAVQFAIDAGSSQARWNFLIGRKVTHNTHGDGVVSNVIVNPDQSVAIWIAFLMNNHPVQLCFDPLVCKELADIEFPDVFPAQTSFAPVYEDAAVAHIPSVEQTKIPVSPVPSVSKTEKKDDAKTVSSPSKKLSKSDPKDLTGCWLDIFAACGVFLLICNIAAGMIFWREWSGWLILALIGYLCFWGVSILRAPINLQRVFVFFTLSNFIFLYYGNLWLARGDLGGSRGALILNVTLGWLFVLGLLLLLVPRKWSSMRSPVFAFWISVSIFVVSYILNHRYPDFWILWLLIDVMGMVGLVYVSDPILEHLGLKDTHLDKLVIASLLMIWCSVSWKLYPGRWWLWSLLLFSVILSSVRELEKFHHDKQGSIRYQLLYVLECLAIPLPFLWNIWQTWGRLVSVIAFALYILGVLAIQRSHRTHPAGQNFKPDDQIMELFFILISIACTMAGIIWSFVAPDQVNKSQWVIAGGGLFLYIMFNAYITEKAKAQGIDEPVWLDLIMDVIGISILAFGWGNPELSRILIGVIGFVAATSLKKVALKLKKEKHPSLFAILPGILLFAVAMWMGQTQPGAYIWQLVLEFEGVAIIFNGVGIQDGFDRFIIRYPWGSVICFFAGMFGFLMCAPYLVKAALVRQPLVYNVLLGMIASSIFMYPTSYTNKINLRNLQLIFEEIVPDKKAQDKILTRLNKWRYK